MPSVQSADKIMYGCFGQIESTVTTAPFQDWQKTKSKKAFKASRAASDHNKMLQHVPGLTPFSM